MRKTRSGPTRASIRRRTSSGGAARCRPGRRPDLQGAQRLLERFLERAADGHRLADAISSDVVSVGVALRELLESEPRDLHHAVVDRRLEAGGRLLRDVVADLVERVARRRASPRSSRSGIPWPSTPAPSCARRAGSSRSRPSRPSSGFTANWMLEPPVSTPISRMIAMRRVAHRLVFLVGQRLRRRDGDAVAGVDAHRVEVLDGADDDDVVLRGRASPRARIPSTRGPTPRSAPRGSGCASRPRATSVVELVEVVGDAAARAAQREATAG